MTRLCLLRGVALVWFIGIYVFDGFAQSQQTIIIYPKSSTIGLNSNIGPTKRVRFTELQYGAEMEKLVVELGKAAHFFDAQVVKQADGTSFEQIANFLIIPADSVIIDTNMQVMFSRNGSANVDKLITTRLNIILERKEIGSAIKQRGLSAFLKDVDNVYNGNEERIKMLALDGQIKKALSVFNYILKCKRQAAIPYETLLPQSEKVLDSIYFPIVQGFKQLGLINTGMENAILYQLLNYHLVKNGIKGDLWSNLDKLSGFPFLKHYMIDGLSQSRRERAKIFEQIKKAKLNDHEIDSIYASLTDKMPALENITIPDQHKIQLQNRQGQTLTLADVLAKAHGRLILIDFWASWCAPCRAEFPNFKSLRKKFKDQPIVFVNFSIDRDDKNKEWKAAIAEEKELDNTNHFRLVDKENSGLAKLLALNAIPRYVLLNSSGKILNSSFSKPSSPGFEDELQEYLRFFKQIN